jgi:hypothetical protein
MDNTEILDFINKHVEIYDNQRREIDKKISMLNNVKYNALDPAYLFKCPQGLHGKDAICTKCDFAEPKYCYRDTFLLPGGKRIQFGAEVDFNKRTCTQWRLKEYTNACGCSGTITCVCGYSNSFCLSPSTPEICPFCGRECTVTPNETMWNDTFPHLLEKVRG